MKRTVLPGTKPEPVTVIESAAEPTNAAVGLIDWMAAVGLATVNEIGVDAPPPGGGLTTVTGAVPELTSRLAGMVAESEVELVNVVVRSVEP